MAIDCSALHGVMTALFAACSPLFGGGIQYGSNASNAYPGEFNFWADVRLPPLEAALLLLAWQHSDTTQCAVAAAFPTAFSACMQKTRYKRVPGSSVDFVRC